MSNRSFSHGWREWNPSPIMNFQLNRFAAYGGEAIIADIERVADRTHSFTDWVREFTALGEETKAQGDKLRAALHFRLADFFAMGDPQQPYMRDQFLRLIREWCGITSADIHRVPYEGRFLHAIRLGAEQPKDILVVHGGFDSYIEEFLPVLLYWREMGYEIIAFEGPGQGTVLYDQHLPMTPDWHKPVAAVLDHFGLDDVTLIGISLGGLLVTRAAAFEPRVKRYVALDALTNLFEHMMRHSPPKVAKMLSLLVDLGARSVVDTLTQRKWTDPFTNWSFRLGLRVMGVQSPYGFWQACRTYDTRSISHLVTQDVLLLGSQADNAQQFYEQIRLLTNARSVTARLFTAAEGAQYHCGVGNLDLVMETVVDWLEFTRTHRASVRHAG